MENDLEDGLSRLKDLEDYIIHGCCSSHFEKAKKYDSNEVEFLNLDLKETFLAGQSILDKIDCGSTEESAILSEAFTQYSENYSLSNQNVNRDSYCNIAQKMDRYLRN